MMFLAGCAVGLIVGLVLAIGVNEVQNRAHRGD